MKSSFPRFPYKSGSSFEAVAKAAGARIGMATAITVLMTGLALADGRGSAAPSVAAPICATCNTTPSQPDPGTPAQTNPKTTPKTNPWKSGIDINIMIGVSFAFGETSTINCLETAANAPYTLPASELDRYAAMGQRLREDAMYRNIDRLMANNRKLNQQLEAAMTAMPKVEYVAPAVSDAPTRFASTDFKAAFEQAARFMPVQVAKAEPPKAKPKPKAKAKPKAGGVLVADNFNIKATGAPDPCVTNCTISTNYEVRLTSIGFSRFGN